MSTFKILILTLLIGISSIGISFAATRTSIAIGSWSSTSTWDCTCVPDSTDNVIIAGGTVVFLANFVTTIVDVEIEAGASMAIFFDDLYIKGDLILNGQLDGAKEVYLTGVGTDIDGTGFFTNTKEITLRGDKNILSTAVLAMVGGDLVIDGAYTVTNYGHFTLAPASLTATDANATFVNETNATLRLGAGSITTGKLEASATDNTVVYYKFGKQNIKSPISSYYNLEMHNTGTKSMVSNLDINGDLRIQNSAQLDTKGFDINLSGNFTNISSHADPFKESTGVILFDGTTDQTIDHVLSKETFYEFEIDKASGTVILNDAISINSLLRFTDGVIDLNDQDLTIESAASINGGGTASYVNANSNGKYIYEINGTARYEFHIGDNSNYSPFDFDLNSYTGSGAETIELSVFNSAHSQINPAAEHIKRYWNLNSTGFSTIDYDVIYYYLDDDTLIGEVDMYALLWNGYQFIELDSINPGSNELTNSISIVAIPMSHDFTAANNDIIVPSTNITSVQDGNWSTPSTWDCSCIPDTTDNAIISAGDTVTLLANDTINNFEIESGGSLQANAKQFHIKGYLILNGTLKNGDKIYIDGANSNVEGGGSFIDNAKVITTENISFTNSADITFSGNNLEIGGGDTITNYGSVTFTNSDLIGLSASSHWINGMSSVLNLEKAALATGTLDASAVGNTVNYNGTGAQDIKSPISSFFNLLIRNANVKKVKSNLDINGQLAIKDAASLNTNNFNINLAGNFSDSSSHADPFQEKIGVVVFDGSGIQYISHNLAMETFYGLNVNNSATNLILNNEITISDSLYLNTGNIVLQDNNLILGDDAEITGTPGTSSYVEADSTGRLRRNFDAIGSYLYPLGDNDDYSPFTLTLNAYSNTGTPYIEMNVSDTNEMNIDTNKVHITRYWTLNSGNFTSINYDVSYQYLNQDIMGAEFKLLALEWNGTAWLSYDSTALATNTLSSSGGISIIPSNNNYTGGDLSNVAGQIISVQSGNWNNASTWDCWCIPDSTDYAIIDSSDTVTLTMIEYVGDFMIDSTARLEGDGFDFEIIGDLTLNGTINDVDELTFSGVNKTLDGNGLFNSINSIYINSNDTVLTTASLEVAGGVLRIGATDTMTNLGSLNFSTAADLDGTNAASLFVNSTNATLYLSDKVMDTQGDLDASATGNLVDYTKNGGQNIFDPLSSYFDLHISTANTKSLSAALDVNGDLLIQGTAQLKSNNRDITLFGDWTVTSTNANPFDEGTGTVTFDGTSDQTITSVIDETYSDLEINKASGTVNLSTNLIVENSLLLTLGVMDLQTNSLLMEPGTSVGGTPGASSYVQADSTGGFQWEVNADGSYVFPIGDADEYSPLTWTLNSQSGAGGRYIEATLRDRVHPSLNTGAARLSRYWNVNTSGFTTINYNVSLDYIQTDVIGAEADLRNLRWNAYKWMGLGTPNVATNNMSTSPAMIIVPSAYVITAGDTVNTDSVIVSITDGDWNDPTTWDCYCIPDTNDNAKIASGDTVTLVDDPTSINNLEIEANAYLDCDQKEFHINGHLIINGILNQADPIHFDGINKYIDGSGIISNIDNMYLNENIEISASAALECYLTDIMIGAADTLENKGIFTCNESQIDGTNASSLFINSSGSYLYLNDTLNMTAGNFDASALANTINYNLNNNQSIFTPLSSYYNLILSNAGTKKQITDIDINGDLTISDLVKLDCNNRDINLAGNWTTTSTNADPFNEQSGLVTFDGTSDQTFYSVIDENFNDLEVNKASNELILTSNVVIENQLDLTSGVLNIQTSNLFMEDGASLGTAAGTGNYVRADSTGGFQWEITGTGSFEFPIGDADEYSPLTLTLNTQAGAGGRYIEASLRDRVHASLNTGAARISRYWTVNTSGFTSIDYDVDMDYIQTDVVGTEADLRNLRWNATKWYGFGTPNTTTNNISTSPALIIVPTSYDFTAGDTINTDSLIVSVTDGNWNNPSTWDCYCIPAANDNAKIISGDTVTLVDDPTYINNFEIESSAMLAGAGKDFHINGHLILDGILDDGAEIHFDGTGKYIDGVGTISNSSDIFINQDIDLLITADIECAAADLTIANAKTLTNYGTLEMSGAADIIGGNASSTLINTANTTLYVNDKIFANFGSLDASANGNTVLYNGSGGQNIASPLSSYYHLSLSNTNTKSLLNNTDINGDLTIAGTAKLNSANKDINLAGDWIVTSTNADPFAEGTGAVIFDGTSNQSLSSVIDETFYELEINKASNELILSTDIIVSNRLTLTLGVLNIQTADLFMEDGSSVTGTPSVNNYVRADSTGGFQWEIAGNGSFEFPIGDADEYSPLTWTLNSQAGAGGRYIEASLRDRVHTSLNTSAARISRYWTVTTSGFTSIDYDVSMDYMQTDVIGTEADLRNLRWNATKWMGLGTPNTATNNISSSSSLTIVPSSYDFTAGDTVNVDSLIISVTDGNWNNPSTWDCYCIPSLNDNAKIVSGDTVTVVIDPTYINNFEIEVSAMLDIAGNDFHINGHLIIDGIMDDANQIDFNGIGKYVDGTGTISNVTEILLNENIDFLVSADVEFDAANLTINNTDTLTNYGTISFSNAADLDGGNNSSLFINETNATLVVNDKIFNVSGKLDASATGNTVEYNKNNTQAIATPISSYYHLIISNTNVKSMANNLDINGDLLVSGSARLDCINKDINLAGNWTITSSNGNPFDEGVGTVTFDGSTQQTITNSADERFFDLVINNSAANIVLANFTDVSVENDLTLTNSNIEIGANLFNMLTAATITGGSSSSYVEADSIGNFRYYISGTGNYFFPIGDNDEYSPMTVTLNSSAGGGNRYFECNVTDAIHPSGSFVSHITRYWTMGSGDFTSIDYDVSYTYVNADIVGTEDSLDAVRYDGSWTKYDDVNMATNTLSSSTGITVIPSGDDFTGGSFGSILPVELIDFDVLLVNGVSEIKWSSASESNLEKYVIERSSDAEHFDPIAEVSAGANSSAYKEYTIYDPKPFMGNTYYRLKMMDEDGQFKYSVIRSVYLDNSDSRSEIKMYPNPIQKTRVLHIMNLDKSLGSDQVELNIFNIMGQNILNQLISPSYDVSGVQIPKELPSGMYKVQMTQDGELIHTQLLVVE